MNKLALEILSFVGGQNNVKNAYHCATRLRLKIIDFNLVNLEKLNELDEVIAVVKRGSQLQIVIGNNVSLLYLEFSKLGNFENEDSNNENLIKNFLEVISSIFMPFLGALAGAGILKGLLSLAVLLNIVTIDSGTYRIFYGAADSIFYFLPMFLAITSAKKFGANQFVSLAIAGALLYPDLSPQLIDSEFHQIGFLGFKLNLANYSSSVIPIVLAVFVQSFLEKFFNARLHSSFRNMLTPVLVLLCIVPITFLIIGPIGVSISVFLANIYSIIYNLSPLLAGFFIGSFWQVLVIFGMHWTFVPIAFNNLAFYGYDTMTPLILGSVIAQAGSCFAIFLKIKDSKMKLLASTSTISALLGITEPAVYGVTLKYVKPFIFACISGGIGSAIIGYFNVKNFGGGLVSLLSIPAFISNDDMVDSHYIYAIFGSIIAFSLAFLLTYFFGIKNVENFYEIQSPVKGQNIDLSKVNDSIFSSNILGPGIGVLGNGVIIAPFDGKIITKFKTNHALGIISSFGVEMLIHIGIDTVKMDGIGFLEICKKQEFKKGDVLLQYNNELIKSFGYDNTVFIFITNADSFLETTINTAEFLEYNTSIFKIMKE